MARRPLFWAESLMEFGSSQYSSKPQEILQHLLHNFGFSKASGAFGLTAIGGGFAVDSQITHLFRDSQGDLIQLHPFLAFFPRFF
jgi:hypothetical protein